MHVQQPPGAGALVQVVHVLRDQQEIARPAAVEFRQRAVRGVGLHGRIGELGAARIVELLHARRIAGEGLRRRHILDPHRCQMPSASRKVDSPLSRETPAPVRTTMPGLLSSSPILRVTGSMTPRALQVKEAGRRLGMAAGM